MFIWDWVRGFLRSAAPLYLYNTKTKQKDVFEVLKGTRRVRMYNCGPTVYGKQHIGNLAMYVFTDVLRRALEWNGYTVKQVINITDVGHLSSDADSGEDKMTLGLKREGLPLTLPNMRILADRYTTIFIADLQDLNIDTASIQFPRASDYIKAQIAMIHTLEEKGYAYRVKSGVYYDTARFPSYGLLGGLDRSGQQEGARVAPALGKHHASDFVLWKPDKRMGWDSPWGKGFPGWHIECSTMIRSTLGQQIDIHTGGIEHIAIHHNNEIAQSEVATSRSPLARFWLHRAHIQIEGGKIAKSEGNVVYLSDVIERGFHPLALRYLFLQAHYRSPSNFSWEALSAAQNALASLWSAADRVERSGESRPNASYLKIFGERINDDLDTPGALAVLWEMIKDQRMHPASLHATLEKMDTVLGLRLSEPDARARTFMRTEVRSSELPETARRLLDERELARKAKEWTRADQLRKDFEAEGYIIEDRQDGARIFRSK